MFKKHSLNYLHKDLYFTWIYCRWFSAYNIKLNAITGESDSPTPSYSTCIGIFTSYHSFNNSSLYRFHFNSRDFFEIFYVVCSFVISMIKILKKYNTKRNIKTINIFNINALSIDKKTPDQLKPQE